MSANRESPYHYTECGLDNVLIEGVRVTIDDDGDAVVTIRNVNGLHKAIAQAIISRHGLMNGPELRFLRTEMGLTQAELAKHIHREALGVGRWERGEIVIDSNAETVIRLLAQEKLKIEINASIEEITGYSVQTAGLQPIRIDGSNPEEYRPMAA